MFLTHNVSPHNMASRQGGKLKPLKVCSEYLFNLVYLIASRRLLRKRRRTRMRRISLSRRKSRKRPLL